MLPEVALDKAGGGDDQVAAIAKVSPDGLDQKFRSLLRYGQVVDILFVKGVKSKDERQAITGEQHRRPIFPEERENEHG